MMIWMQAIATGVFCGAVIYETVKNSKKAPPCETCEHLMEKGGGGLYKYYCDKPINTYSHEFDKPPEYCGNYEPREDGE